MRTARHYVDPKSYEYDPRFMVFEFTWNIILRKKQVEMIWDFMEASSTDGGYVPTGKVASSSAGAGKGSKKSKSMVKQLIMGRVRSRVPHSSPFPSKSTLGSPRFSCFLRS